MRNGNPIENTGLVLRQVDGAFLGSCFIIRYADRVLTAHHVIREFKVQDLCVVFPASRAGNTRFLVRQVDFHPTADLAVLQIEPVGERDITWPVTTVFDDRGFGLDVMTFGFPQDWDQGRAGPTARYFKGHVQRFFEHESHLGYTYTAAELSFACPGGLSGSFLLNPQAHGRLYGVVTENRETTTELRSTTEVEENGSKYRESFHSVINYGIAVWLPPLEDWLNTVVPPVDAEELNRRGKNQHAWAAEEKPPHVGG